MKKLIFILLLSSLSYGQAKPYVGFSFDANKAFHLKDNPRTVDDTFGIDYNFEVGVIVKKFGLGIHYGEFPNKEIRSYGIVADYYPGIFRWIDTSFGITIGKIEQKVTAGNFRTKWSPLGRFSGRIIATVYFSEKNNIGLSFKGEVTQKINIPKGYIFEGSIGIIYKFKNN